MHGPGSVAALFVSLAAASVTGCAPPQIDDAAFGVDDVDAVEQGAQQCDPYAPRDPAPEVLVGPGDFEPALLDLLDSAKSSVDVMIYQLSRPSFVTALANAAKRGVAVRVLVDPDEDLSQSHQAKLESAGAQVVSAPASFAHAHAKVIIVDAEIAAILSGNLNYFTMVTERNYAVLDAASDDVADAAAVFEHDWSGAPLDLGCTRLIVAPENARTRLLALVKSAETRLDLAVMYLSDASIKAAVKARAKAGVPTRVLLASPGWIPGNAKVAADLVAAGAEARFFTSFDLHAKLIVADDTAFVGSENFSYTSLKKNREVGVFVTEPDAVAPIDAQLDADWAGADAP